MRRILAVCRRVQKSQNGGLELNYKKRTEKRDSITGGDHTWKMWCRVTRCVYR